MIFRYHFLIFLALTHLFTSQAYSQELNQTIRGIITEAHTEMPLPGATVILITGEQTTGTTSDANGRFQFAAIPLGRHHIKVSYVGYKPYEQQNLSLNSGKELFLEIRLEESTLELEAFEFTYQTAKESPLNEMALVSARMFTIEETERYAGSIGDPARMASNFAGVGSINDQSNDISIRGNSPYGMLWMLEGVDIPNPSHFGTMGGTGGAISMLNNNTLSNSDFFTGAFPAQYGNALSGVFDLNLRNGNSQKFEFLGQVAFNGFEIGMEGPLSRKNNTSFIANYRYSTMAVLDKFVGLENLSLMVVPYYQDLSFKSTFYRGKLGTLSLFALGGINHINMDESDTDPEQWTHELIGQKMQLNAASGSAGLKHVINPGPGTKLETTLAFTHSSYGFTSDTLTRQNPQLFPQHRHNDKENSVVLRSHLTWKMNARNIVSTGFYIQPMQFQFVDSIYRSSLGSFLTFNNLEGNYTLSKFFGQWKHNFSDNISLVAGSHFMHFSGTNDFSVEPRLAFRYGFEKGRALSFAAGLHAHLAPRLFYVYQSFNPASESFTTSGDNLRFTRSAHFIAGYDHMLNAGTRLKIETYYQYHYNVPVTSSIPGWSLLNYGADWVDFIAPIENLENKGTGQNYGVELTLERFLSKGYYYLITGSLYEAKYKGYDQIERNSIFSGNFILNALVGKEFTIRKHNVLSIDAKMVYAGSKRYLPFTFYQISDYHFERIDDWDQAYLNRLKDFFRINLRIGYRINFRGTTHEIAMDVYNLTNRKNIFLENFDPYTGKTETYYQFPFFPVAMYRIQF